MEMIRKCLFGCLFTLSFCFTTVAGQSFHPEGIEALIEAVRQAQKPTHNMRISWQEETINPSIAILRSGAPHTLPARPPHTHRKYTVTLSGLRSRIEELRETYETPDSKEHYKIDFDIHVFDGSIQRRIRNRIKGENTKSSGWQYLRDKNSPLLSKILFGCKLDFHNAKVLAKHRFELVQSDRPGLYLLDAIKPDETRYRFTIDANKNFNIIKTEWLRPDDSKIEEINVTLKQYANGVWFPAEREIIRYSLKGKRYTDRKVKFTKAEFDIEIPEDTFKLEFPNGTEVWDGIVQDWFVVGAPGPITTGRDFLDTLAQKEHSKEGQIIQTSKEQGLSADSPETRTSQAEAKQEKTPKVPLTTTPKRHILLWSLLALPLIILFLIVFRAMKATKK